MTKAYELEKKLNDEYSHKLSVLRNMPVWNDGIDRSWEARAERFKEFMDDAKLRTENVSN